MVEEDVSRFVSPVIKQYLSIIMAPNNTRVY